MFYRIFRFGRFFLANSPKKKDNLESLGNHVSFSNGRVAKDKELHSIKVHPILWGWFMTLTILPQPTQILPNREREIPLKIDIFQDLCKFTIDSMDVESPPT